jgi:hypothetical protein
MFRLRRGRNAAAAARNQTVSVHVTSSLSGRTFHRTLSRGSARALIAAGAALVLAAISGLAGLLGWVGSSERMTRLQTENDSLRVQFRRLGELEADLARMSALNEQMQKMLGVELSASEPGTGLPAGAGGAPGSGLVRSRSSGAGDPAGDSATPAVSAEGGTSRREAGAD